MSGSAGAERRLGLLLAWQRSHAHTSASTCACWLGLGSQLVPAAATAVRSRERGDGGHRHRHVAGPRQRLVKLAHHGVRLCAALRRGQPHGWRSGKGVG